MRLLIKICFYILLAVDCHAQIYTDQLDSIHKVLSTTSNDTIRMDMFARLGFYFDDVNLDSAVYYGEKGAAIASRLRLELNEAQIITSMCWPLDKQGNYPRALKLLNQALEIANDPSSEKSIGNLPKGQNSNTFRLLILSNIHLGFGFCMAIPVTMKGGNLLFESREGEATTFYIHLPA